MKNNIFILFFALALMCCKKDLQSDILDNYFFDMEQKCDSDTMPTQSGFQPGAMLYTYTTDDFEYPSFNPNNSEELIYCNKKYSPTLTYEIFILNRVDLSKRLLTTMQISSPPKWGKNGWILLNAGKIYKIKENGDSLQAIASGYSSEWNFDCTKFAYTTINEVTHKTIGVIYDVNTTMKDTLPFTLASHNSWQNKNNLLLFYSDQPSYEGFNIVDINLQKRMRIWHITSSAPPCWLNEDEFVYIWQQKLYKFSIPDNTSTCIAQFCKNDFAIFLSYSHLSKELITSVEHEKYIGNGTIEVADKIMILNFNDNSVTYINP